MQLDLNQCSQPSRSESYPLDDTCFLQSWIAVLVCLRFLLAQNQAATRFMKIGFEQSGCHPDGDYSGEWGGRIPLSLTTVLAAQKWSGHPDSSRLLLVKSQVHQPSMLCPVNWCTRLESNQRCFLRAGLQSAATQPTVASRTLKNGVTCRNQTYLRRVAANCLVDRPTWHKNGGDDRTRICNNMRARQALYQLSYIPVWNWNPFRVNGSKS